ncbi:MAG: hypothetical protein ABIK92_12830 [Pseudomonadota bacterium]
MRPADRQSALKKAGFTQKDIAKELGMGQMPVSNENNGVPTYESIRQGNCTKDRERINGSFPAVLFWQ